MDLAPGLNRVCMALAGLLMLLACSTAPPTTGQQTKAAIGDSTGQAPVNRARDTLSRFTKLSRYGYDGSEIESIGDRHCRLLPIASAELREAFPQVRFYLCIPTRGGPWDFRSVVSRGRNMIAVTGDTFYLMPLEFNRLLFATGQLLTDSNIVKMAKACVALDAVVHAERDTADPLSVPQIVILDAREIKRTVVDGDTYDVYVKARVGDEVQERYLENRFRQFRSIYMKNPHLEEDMKKPPGLCGTIRVIGYAPHCPLLVNPKSGEYLPGFPGMQ